MDAHMISHEWATRPDDQRFLSLESLHNHNMQKRADSLVKDTAVEHLRLAVENDDLYLRDSQQDFGRLNNWSFGQLCQRAGAPAGYLRKLPTELAAIPLQWSLEAATEDLDAKVLVRKPRLADGERFSTISALTSPSYGRIYDAEMSGAMMQRIDLNVWKVPSASYASSDPKKATTLYASDRDCFVALVDDQHPIEVPGKNGHDTLFRGFIARNSEVGAAAFDFFTFLYKRICDNRIIHGLMDGQSLKIRHTSGGPSRFFAEVRPTLGRYLEAGTAETVGMIRAAQDKEVAKSKKDVGVWLKARGFTTTQATKIADKAEEEEGSARSVWSLVNAATAIAHDIKFGDERLAFEKQAAKMLDTVAA